MSRSYRRPAAYEGALPRRYSGLPSMSVTAWTENAAVDASFAMASGVLHRYTVGKTSVSSWPRRRLTQT